MNLAPFRSGTCCRTPSYAKRQLLGARGSRSWPPARRRCPRANARARQPSRSGCVVRRAGRTGQVSSGSAGRTSYSACSQVNTVSPHGTWPPMRKLRTVRPPSGTSTHDAALPPPRSRSRSRRERASAAGAGWSPSTRSSPSTRDVRPWRPPAACMPRDRALGAPVSEAAAASWQASAFTAERLVLADRERAGVGRIDSPCDARPSGGRRCGCTRTGSCRRRRSCIARPSGVTSNRSHAALRRRAAPRPGRSKGRRRHAPRVPRYVIVAAPNGRLHAARPDSDAATREASRMPASRRPHATCPFPSAARLL